MSDYTKITDFTAKDSLLSGDPAKLIKGSDFDAEFDALATAIATKYDASDNPTFGTVTITNDLTVADDVAVNTDKFTVDGATGNTAIAGTLGVTGNVAVNTDKFTVAASSGNTVVAGTLAVTGILSAAATESKATNGYVKLPSGIYLQWNTVTIGASGSTSGSQSVSYPTAFPTGVLQVLVCGQTPVTPVAGAAFSASSAGTSSFTLGWAVKSAGDMSGGTIVTYLAVGY